jgi:hypothetical protein
MTADAERIAEAEELASLLGNLYPRYRLLLGRSDFRDALTKLAGKLAKETCGTPVATELEGPKRSLEALG